MPSPHSSILGRRKLLPRNCPKEPCRCPICHRYLPSTSPGSWTLELDTPFVVRLFALIPATSEISDVGYRLPSARLSAPFSVLSRVQDFALNSYYLQLLVRRASPRRP